MLRRLTPILFISLLSTFAWSAPNSVYISPTQASNGASEEGSAVHDLVEAAVSETGEYKIAGESKDAKIILKSKIVKLGSALIVTVEKLENGQIKFASQLKAQKAEELDIVCRRLTRAVLTEKAPSTDMNVHEVTQAEAITGTNRKDVIGRWIFGLGPAELINLNNGSTAALGATLGYTWELADPAVMLKLAWDGAQGISSFGIGGDYFFSQTSTSFFAGLDLGYGGAQIQGNVPPEISTTSVSGFAMGANLGVAFFRTSKVNVELALRYLTVFSNNSYGLPGTYGFRLNILF